MRKINSEKFNYIMQELCLSYEDLSKKTGISATGLYKIRTGQAIPRPRNLKKICEALNCEPKDILEDNPKEG